MIERVGSQLLLVLLYLVHTDALEIINRRTPPNRASPARRNVLRTESPTVTAPDITTAAIAHLAHSTPEEFRFTSTDFNSYVTVSTATGAPQRHNGTMKASESPGLGVSPRFDVIGPRLVEVS